MLINWAKEENEGEKSDQPSAVSSGYQNASELFDYMARQHNLDVDANNSLSKRDLVILYENIEIGSKLLSHAGQVKRRLPNQLVETIVYNDEQSDSEVSDILSNEDLLHMCRTNNETMDILNCPSAFENTLCHKISNIKLHNGNLNTDYDKYLLKDPYIKAQLKNLKLTTREFDTMLPASLLDYVCCKRLEENYNIYMDNIIRYVTHTIEQLKRISNGDYLTEKAKEKWREIPENKKTTTVRETDMKVLATSTSFPLRFETKLTGMTSMWDDIVRSEVDIRSLSKILEKKLVIEVPRLIEGSYKLLSKQYADNLFISCETQNDTNEDKGSRVDVVLQLERSKTGQNWSNINSIMILQATTSPNEVFRQAIPLPYKGMTDNESTGTLLAIEDVTSSNQAETKDEPTMMNGDTCDDVTSDEGEESDYDHEHEHHESLELIDYEEGASSLPVLSSNDSTLNLKEIITSSEPSLQQNDSINNLHMTMQHFDVLDTLPEEPVKKKSVTKVRIKSPYANNSRIIEEKKRKRLLEIKEKREKRKMAINESCKITKNKYGKSTITPQAASSVTKLSITNKSFYNSIYGHFTMDNNGFHKRGRNLSKKESVAEVPLEVIEQDVPPRKNTTPEKNSLKFIDRSYYLDNTITAMDLQKKQIPTDRKSDSASEKSSSTKLLNINILSELIESFTESIDKVQSSQPDTDSKNVELDESLVMSDRASAEPFIEELKPKSRHNIVTLECRKSIEKIYSLMNKSETARNKEAEKLLMSDDSATSIQDGSKTNNLNSFRLKIKAQKDNEKSKVNNKNMPPQGRKSIAENPLKAISQLLHEFEAVKKNRQKSLDKTSESNKINKRPPEWKLTAPGRRRPQTDDQIDDRRYTDKPTRLLRDKRVNRSTPNVETVRVSSPKKTSPIRTNSPKRHSPKRIMSPKKPAIDDSLMTKKRIADLIDEAKEAKGEAVKGPPRLSSARLNALAQPKKSYVAAHSEEYQTRYGRNLMADRLDRLAAATDRHNVRNRLKRFNEPTSNTPQKTSPAQPLDSHRRSPPRIGSPTKQNQGVTNVRDAIKMLNVEETKPIAKREIVVPLDQYSRPMKLSAVKEGFNVRSRTPHIPQDWDKNYNTLPQNKISNPNNGSQGSSLTNSSDMGIMLHRLINKIVTTEYVVSSYEDACGSIESTGRKTDSLLGTDCEDFEYPSEHSADRKRTGKVKHKASPTSTMVEYFSDSSHSHYTKYGSSIFAKDEENFTGSVNTAVDKELEKLVQALSRKMSTNNLQNSLRMKTLTLTPIQSAQQAMIVESGDANSLVLQSKSSKIIDIHSLHPYETSLSDATSLRQSTQPTQNVWGFTHTQIPMQLYTVGYAIPQYDHINTQMLTASVEVRAIKSSTSCAAYENQDPLIRIESRKSHNSVKKQLNSDLVDKEIEIAMKESSEVIEEQVYDKPDDLENQKIEVNNELGAVTLNVQKDEIFQKDSEEIIAEKPNENQVPEQDTSVIRCKSAVSGTISLAKTNQKNSLDVLVGLLDEIKKLTECRTQITDNDLNPKETDEMEKIPTNANTDQKESIKNLFNNASKFNKVKEVILVHQAETDTSLDMPYDLFDTQSLTKRLSIVDINSPNSIYIDKTVSVNFGKELVNKTTDVPSRNCMITMTRSTSFTQSMMNILQDYAAFTIPQITMDCQEMSMKPSESNIDFELRDKYTEKNDTVDEYKDIKDLKEVNTIPIENNTPYAVKIEIQAKSSLDTVTVVRNVNSMILPKTGGCITAKDHIPDGITVIKDVKKLMKPVKKSKETKPVNTQDPVSQDLDVRQIKLKRDVLVTVYSLLVITVFAALSLPSLLYRT